MRRRVFSGFCFLLLLLLHSGIAVAVPLEADIKSLFPKLTRIGPVSENPSVTPVYQLDQLLGYAFETNDMTDLPGFSGERINLLIGLDTSGRFAGMKVLNHHEPIFLHGLGERPMVRFIGQYSDLSVADRIIVDSRYAGEEQQDGTVFIDGVTKATVSVLVINDTVLSAALKVARAYLDDFAQAPSATVKTELFQGYSWEQLLEEGLVKEWRVTEPQLVEALSQPLASYEDESLQIALEESNGEWLGRYYYTYLNAPVSGRNLLGDEEFERLMTVLRPGEHALLVLSEGPYPFLEHEFRRGTVPQRLSLSQGGLPVDIRDLDFFESDSPLLNIDGDWQGRIFRIKAQAGFDPSLPMMLGLNLKLRRNHLVSDSAVLSDELQMPGWLFDFHEQEVSVPEPLWQRLWRDRALILVALVSMLVVVSAAFIWQHRLAAYPGAMHRLRWSVMILTLFFVGFYAQGQLSVVNIYTLLLALVNGFDITVFLLDPVLFVLWSYIFITLFLWGRGVFCGWLCPFGVMQEIAGRLAGLLKIRQIRVAARWHYWLQKLKYLILLVLVGSAFWSVTLAEQLAEIEPFKTAVTLVFIRSWPFVLYTVLLLVLSMYIHKVFCRYLCPLGAGLAVLGRFSLFHWLQRRAECGKPCQLCRVRCEIDAIHRDGSIDYDECVQCMECIVILHDKQQCAIELSQKKRRARQQISAREIQD